MKKLLNGRSSKDSHLYFFIVWDLIFYFDLEFLKGVKSWDAYCQNLSKLVITNSFGGRQVFKFPEL